MTSGLEQIELTSPQRVILTSLLTSFADSFAAIVAYGSRALGDARPGSDLDLAVIGPASPGTVGNLYSALDESDLPFSSDVVSLDDRLDSKVRGEILRDGIVLAGSHADQWRSLI